MRLEFCVICGVEENLHHHHVTPKSEGGSDDETNLITLCVEHHAWIHSLRPGTWNSSSELTKKSLREAQELGFSVGRPRKIFSPELVDDIVNMRNSKNPVGIRKIAETFGCGVGTVYKILEDPEEYKNTLTITEQNIEKKTITIDGKDFKSFREYKAYELKQQKQKEKELKEYEKFVKKENELLSKIIEIESSKIDLKLDDVFKKSKKTIISSLEREKIRMENKIEDEHMKLENKLEAAKMKLEEKFENNFKKLGNG
jgi:hypothetical protein